MPEERQQRETDLVLPLGVHAFVLDTTKGNVNVYVGPMKQPLSPQQDVPVIMTDAGRFERLDLERAIKNNVQAYKGQYVVLRNPAKEGRQPKVGGMSTPDPEVLRMGEKVNLPGPITFPLWPMQRAEVVDGHHLKSNQYLLVRVYDEEAARKNWSQGTIVESKPAGEEPPKQGGAIKMADIDPATLVIGQQLIIKGTEVSFYIPPTGVEALKDESSKYVREALTLERLEYCLLVDEDGNKRYVQGPEVVFPKPTESFKLNDDGDRKSRAYELNEISGLHIKVIADYVDSFGAEHNEGDELFITGRRTSEKGSEEETQIYFPRVEHALLKYGGRTRYHAIAIPIGDARYVMDRLTGVVRQEHGPSMFLPDPRKEVIVKRVLSDSEVETYYPGNAKVAAYNASLRQDEEDEAEMSASLTGMPSYRTGHPSASIMFAAAGPPTASISPGGARSADVIDRGTRFTPPRTIVLDSKFEGAVKVYPWTGYAIQVVNQAGERRIEVGPKPISLEFDERLEILSLSTGTPKTADKPLRTVYLRVANNAVSDKFVVKTKDLVPISLHLKYLVEFEDGKKDHWFSVDNYVQLMVDRFRSLISNYTRTVEVRQFYEEVSTLLRNLILGQKIGEGRPGHPFEENGMRVVELDVLEVTIQDAKIAASLGQLQSEKISNSLEVDRAESALVLIKKKEEASQEGARARHTTFEVLDKIKKEQHESELADEKAKVQGEADVELLRITWDKQAADRNLEIATVNADAARATQRQIDERLEEELARTVSELVEQAKADTSRIVAISPQLTQALVALAQVGSLEMVAKHLGDLSIIRQQSLGGTFKAMFEGTPIAGLLENIEKLGVGAAVGKE